MKEQQALSEDFCLKLVAELARDGTLHCELPGGGHLHMDRQLPFLCVYRLPAGRQDSETAQLITSQAAYLIVTEEVINTGEISRLITTISRAMSEIFGAFLLLEIWAGEAVISDRPRCAFRLLAHSAHPTPGLLEAMEAALLRIRMNGQPPAIKLQYGESILAPGKKPLLPDLDPGTSKTICIGMEVSPCYRDAETGELFVFAYKKFRERFNRALKRCFYEFTHLHTTNKPTHYHELGPQAVAREAVLVDERLAKISGQFDLLLFVSPVNFSAAWQAFQDVGQQRPVEFLYRSRTMDPDLLKRQLFDIPLENVEDPTLYHIFNAKREELDRQITLLSDRNTSRFLLGCRQLFGDVSQELLQTALEILNRIPAPDGDGGDKEFLDARQFADYAEQEVEYYRQQDSSLAARVEVRDDIPGIMVSHGNFLIGSNAQIASSRVAATLAHEVGTHVLTYHNGRKQPFRELYVGMAGYEPMQEGLAVLSEYLVGQLDSGRLRQLAGRVVAVHSVIGGADFMETYRLLNQQYGFSPRGAFSMAMRTHRGGGYIKDAVYLKGLVGLLEKLSRGKNLQSLYLGKVALEYLGLIEELRWRRILERPPLVPRLFATQQAQQRITRLAEGMTVLDLVEEIT